MKAAQGDEILLVVLLDGVDEVFDLLLLSAHICEGPSIECNINRLVFGTARSEKQAMYALDETWDPE